MTKITLQEAFNRAWQTFIVEDKPPCVDTYGICLYGDKETGQRCAIGLCLTDEQIDQLKDCGASRLLYKRVPSIIGLYPDWFDLTDRTDGSAISAFSNLQNDLHDAIPKRLDNGSWAWLFNVNQRKKIYTDFASEFGLTIPGENNEQQPDNASRGVQ